MIRIEYRYPWDSGPWAEFGVTSREDWAQEVLEVCRQNHPGSECRVHAEEAAARDFANAV